MSNGHIFAHCEWLEKIRIDTTKNVELKYNRFMKKSLVRVGTEYGGETYERRRQNIQKWSRLYYESTETNSK